jgi:hypothetical protein
MVILASVSFISGRYTRKPQSMRIIRQTYYLRKHHFENPETPPEFAIDNLRRCAEPHVLLFFGCVIRRARENTILGPLPPEVVRKGKPVYMAPCWCPPEVDLRRKPRGSGGCPLCLRLPPDASGGFIFGLRRFCGGARRCLIW